jgi:hypothetical protein
MRLKKRTPPGRYMLAPFKNEPALVAMRWRG